MAKQTASKTWSYDPGDRLKVKHGWNNNYPGFAHWRGRYPVGKCPKGMPRELAEEILNEGVRVFEEDNETDVPDYIYGVNEGVVYKAVPTRLGVSYHGFPEHSKYLSEEPDEVIQAIKRLAKRKKCLKEVEKWLKS